MSQKKGQGQPTRKSPRLTRMSEEIQGTRATTKATAQATENLDTQKDADPNRLLQSIEEDTLNEAEEDLTNPETPPEKPLSHQPRPLHEMATENNLVNELLARISQLEAVNDPRSRSRGVTPEESAFGGANFKPTSFAALKAFKPYGRDQDAKNPSYDRKARCSGVNPGIFSGDKEAYDSWVIKLADKFDEDDETFKKERSRMALINSLTEGNANSLLEARYRSDEIPFSSAAEMIATLSAVYHDENQGSKAREALRKLKYDPFDKSTDIHQFIGLVNSLADKANIAKSDRKTTLYEHIPASLNPQLLSDSKDPWISYEVFASKVADSALAQQRAVEERREMRERRNNRERKTSPPQHREHTTSRRGPMIDSKPANPTSPRDTSEWANKRSEQLKIEGRCYLCQEKGHQVKDCPQKKDIAAILAACENDDDNSRNETSSSSDDSKNGDDH
jgi:hypothetical protein